MNPLSLLRTIVDLTFLALAILLITTLLSNRYDSTTENTLHSEIQSTKEDILGVHLKNISYIENRLNRVTESTDSYQVGVNNRLTVLERKMESLDTRAKESTRVVNNQLKQ